MWTGRLIVVLVLPVVSSAVLAAACGSEDAVLAPDAREGRRIAISAGCAGCHGADGEGGVGPAWVGTFGAGVELDDGSRVVVDRDYLVRAIAEPDVDVAAGYDVAMPDNGLDDEEIGRVIDYIVALGPETTFP